MRNVYKRILLILIFVLVGLLQPYAKNWESVQPERVADARLVVRASEIEIKTKKGAIIVSTQHPTTIKVYTILGQLVSQENLSEGVSQLNIGTHGVFIVKVGELTCKVAL